MDEDDDDGDDDDFCTKEDLVGCDDDNSDNDVWAEPVDMICEFVFCGWGSRPINRQLCIVVSTSK